MERVQKPTDEAGSKTVSEELGARTQAWRSKEEESCSLRFRDQLSKTSSSLEKLDLKEHGGGIEARKGYIQDQLQRVEEEGGQVPCAWGCRGGGSRSRTWP